MLPPLPHLRCERKFVAADLSPADAVAMIRRHPALFREIYPPRIVNNIYLDSVGLRAYFEHIEGATERVKTRIRWYGSLNGNIARPTLERKLKRGAVSGKASHALPALSLNGHVPRAMLATTLSRAALPDMLQATLRHLQPSLVNRYQRQYWLSACGRFRMTIDWNLQFADPHALAAAASTPHSSTVILELKFHPRDMDDAATVTNALPLRLSRCSKYVLGIERLGGAF